MNKVQVLFIEDDTLDQRAFFRMTREKALPWEVVLAASLDEARTQLKTRLFDVIVADYHLPDGHSTELFGEVPAIPFVLVTATLEEQLAIRTLERGADDYLIKDMDRRYLGALPLAVEKTLHRKQIRDRERRSTEQLELLIKGVKDYAIYMLDKEGRITTWNPGAERIKGYDFREIIGKNFSAFFTPEDVAKGKPALELKIAREQGSYSEEGWRVRKNGIRFWAAVTVTALYDERGEVRGFVKVTRDISERKWAEDELKRQSAGLRAEQNRLNELLHRFASGAGYKRLRGWNAWLLPFLAVAAAVALKLALGPWFGTRILYGPFFLAVAATALFGGFWPGILATLFSMLYVSWLSFAPFHGFIMRAPEDPAGLAVFFGISLFLCFLAHGVQRARQLAEEAARQTRKVGSRLQRFYQSGLLGVIYWDITGQVTDANDKFLEMVGYSREDLEAGRIDWVRITPPEYKSLDEKSVAELKATGENKFPFEKEYIHKNGARIPVLVAAAMLDGARFEGVAFVLDISERKRAEDALRRQAAIIDLSPDAIIIRSIEGTIKFWSAGAEKLYGWSKEEALGRSTHALLRTQFPEPPEKIIEKLKKGENWTGELIHQTKAGQQVILQSYWHGEEVKGELEILESNVDITERKHAEDEIRAARISAEQAKSAAEQASQAKDQFLAVLSHELRTPLSPVSAAVQLMQRRNDLDAKMQSHLEIIRRNVDLEARLIDDLLDLTRIIRGKISLEKKPVSVCTVLDRVLETCQSDIQARKLHLKVTCEDENTPVLGDLSRLQQVLWNLLKNSIKFTPDGGCIGVQSHTEDGQIVIEVKDSGIGIEAGDLPRIFDAFEQGEKKITRQFGGLGLGLAISKKLVEMHDGVITAESGGAGKGATFRVRLPVYTEAGENVTGETAKAVDGAWASAVTKKHILLVEDHSDTALMMKALVEDLGHEVQTAASVEQALLASEKEKFDLIISDLGLPDRSGFDLMRELRERGSTLKGIAVSGYGREEDIKRSAQAGFSRHITKPVSFDVLASAIEQVL